MIIGNIKKPLHGPLIVGIGMSIVLNHVLSIFNRLATHQKFSYGDASCDSLTMLQLRTWISYILNLKNLKHAGKQRSQL